MKIQVGLNLCAVWSACMCCILFIACVPVSHIRLFATPWTVAHQASLSMGFHRQEYQSGLPFFSPGNLPGPGIKPPSLALAEGFLTTEPPVKIILLHDLKYQQVKR